MMKNWKVAVLAGVALFWSFPLQAQSVDSLRREVNNLKEDMQLLQRQIYRSGNGEGVSAAASSNVQQRLSQMDETVRFVSGRMDELEHKIKQANERIDMISKDFDVRFKLLEGKSVAGSGAGTAAKSKRHEAPVAQNPAKSLTGDSVKGGELAPLPKPEKKAAPAAKEQLGVKELYQRAMKAFNENKPAEAEKDFKEILSAYPKDTLAGNAQYWLGEIYYNKADYSRAAVAFGKVYKSYKDGNKGADGLYKLGMSMQKLDKKAEACAAFQSLSKEFPSAEKALKDKAVKAAAALKCK